MPAKRTRPGAKSPDRTEPQPPCCTPYPDATFVNQSLVRLYEHHKGPTCGGLRVPLSIKDWNAEIDRRDAARKSNGGDV